MAEDGRKGRGRRWPESADIALTSGIFQTNGAAARGTIYEQLSQAILYGSIPPGAWLRQNDLAEQFGVSRTPIREAMRALEQEGLIEIIPNHGARAAPLSLEVFEELYALRIGLEGLAARLSARMATSDDVATLRQAYRALEAQEHTASLMEYLSQEWQFRLRCYAVTGRKRLLAQVQYLRQHAERYLRLAYTVHGRTAESLRFHRDLLEAIASGAEADAERINQDALRWTLAKAGPIIAQRIAEQG
jgi:DNA-binding GntR family transcriptional regulator